MVIAAKNQTVLFICLQNFILLLILTIDVICQYPFCGGEKGEENKVIGDPRRLM